MSVLIRGMEMPTSCFDCPFMYGRRYCIANSKIEFNDPDYSELKGRYDGCPLDPVPPHGDLIDQHRLIDVGYHLKRTVKDRSDLDAAAGVEALLYYVIEAPTVIPAEEEN